MDQVPDFWRTAVWHPLSVHFPIVLLLFATLARLVVLFLSENHKSTWRYMSRLMLYTGVLAAWVGVYTGNLADGAVSRTLCDPTVLKSHENAAYILSWLFSVAALLDLFAFLPPAYRRYGPWREALILVLLLVGSGYLVYAGHLGASVVYQQGGGVYHPSADCQEFN